MHECRSKRVEIEVHKGNDVAAARKQIRDLYSRMVEFEGTWQPKRIAFVLGKGTCTRGSAKVELGKVAWNYRVRGQVSAIAHVCCMENKRRGRTREMDLGGFGFLAGLFL